MTIFTDTEAATKLSSLLEKATTDGEVRIKRSDGQEFTVRPANRSPLDIGFVEINPPLTADEIVNAVREGRDRT